MIKFENKYMDSEGKIYDIRNVSLSEKKDLTNIGKFVTETKRDNFFFGETEDCEEGVYIYKSNFDPKKAFRIYKDFGNYKYTYHSDHRNISKLIDLQKDVKLTEFPTGIITLENSVIGQEIPFYENYKTLYEIIENTNDIKLILHVYKRIILILEELSKVGITYRDIHARNFMIQDKDVKLIDFEDTSISFDLKYSYKPMMKNLLDLINSINKKLNIGFQVNSENLVDLKEEIRIKSKNL